MARTRVQLKDRLDDKGQAIWVEANEIVLDDKKVPVRAEVSPLQTYGITVNQFSITATDYDELSLAQFKAKQEAYLAAERSKAQREQEVQQRLYIIAQGERQAAEETAKGNVLMATQTVAAQTKVRVAEQEKLQAETLASQRVAVAELTKKEAETKAAQDAEVARIGAEQSRTVLVTQANAQKESAALQAEADKLKATGIVALAEAKQKEIQLAGAVKDSDRVLATIAADRDVKVAENLSKIAVPQNIILSGGAGGTGSTGIDPFLFNINLLKNSGLLDMNKSSSAPQSPPQK
jgi:hypothetical protein